MNKLHNALLVIMDKIDQICNENGENSNFINSEINLIVNPPAYI